MTSAHPPQLKVRTRGPKLAMVGIVAICGFALSCATDDSGACLDPLPRDCQPAFPPTYTGFYDNLLRETCGAASTGGSCHGPNGKKAGLVLSDRTEAYDYLLGQIDGRARVVPSDPECSLLEQRLESKDPSFVMPPGAKLSEYQRCAIRQWIANGAKRD
jgi:hypothetical protein